MIRKAFAYVVRTESDGNDRSLLVFTDPHGKRSIPKGTVNLDESPDEGGLRELFEESGIAKARIIRHLGERRVTVRGGPEMKGPYEDQHHFAFLVESLEELPDTWNHIVSSDGIDNGMVYRYAWLPLESLMTSGLDYGADQFLQELLEFSER